MILKDLLGKARRFTQGRISSLGDKAEGTIPPSCLHLYAPRESDPKFVGNRTLAILFSGDGGWARLTTHLSKRLQTAGIPVVGIDSMQYFWKEKDARNAAHELGKLIATTHAQWHTDSVVLLGYSMGADVLPGIAQALPENHLRDIKRIILMSPSHRVQLKFRFIGWLGFETPNGVGAALLPDLEVLARRVPISCFAGEKEQDSLVRSLPDGIASVNLLPGGHHYGSDYETLSDEIISVIDA